MSRQDRLLYLVKTYPKDFEAPMAKYKSVCERAKVEPKNFLGDATLVTAQEFITVSAVVDAIELQTKLIIEDNEELKKEADEEVEAKKAAKRAKLDEDNPYNEMNDCACGSRKFLQLSSRGKDNSGFTLPSGRVVESSYMPDFGLPDYDPDGIHITLCVECGRIQGFNKAMAQAAIEREEAKEDKRQEEQED